jgi:hypothetical protein
MSYLRFGLGSSYEPDKARRLIQDFTDLPIIVEFHHGRDYVMCRDVFQTFDENAAKLADQMLMQLGQLSRFDTAFSFQLEPDGPLVGHVAYIRHIQEQMETKPGAILLGSLRAGGGTVQDDLEA